ncbi:MAG: hypothetical protein HQM11_12525 [SAR324 cluster bacterium]|nr:hypothetical protein [SAR324 cluster bacterium]
MSESSEKILVNVHGALKYEETIQLWLTENQLVEGERFIYENVGYEITHVIREDVERPIVYVLVLDIFV